MVKEERGQALLEFALVLPILLLLLCGLFDFGRVIYTTMQMNIITQESVRLGGLGKDDNTITEFAKSRFDIGDKNKLQVQIAPLQGDRKSGDYVTVTLKYPVQYATPFLSIVVPSPYQAVTHSTIRVE